VRSKRESASPFHFFENIRERKNRLHSKPLRGEAAAAPRLWNEGDLHGRLRAARSAKPSHEGFAARSRAKKHWTSNAQSLKHWSVDAGAMRKVGSDSSQLPDMFESICKVFGGLLWDGNSRSAVWEVIKVTH